ncbi:winged helix-turn-helix transcriptional regulator [Hymenobacter terrenus]|uniref:winged helix-turn-helix transcriptional regulator n=1 Tax=Hymenobacter terrenus TaxID=1629124 RepID=UPI00061A0A4F|nr:helix-turn-helix domain-containing protein [Hymenobacter terrenus]
MAPRKETSTNYLNEQVLGHTCVLNEVLSGISGRWKMQVLYLIAQDQNRFSLLKATLPTLSDQTLGKRLRELEQAGLVTRHPDATVVPPQVRYAVTPKGGSLLTLLQAMCRWGTDYW